MNRTFNQPKLDKSAVNSEVYHVQLVYTPEFDNAPIHELYETYRSSSSGLCSP